MVFAILSLIVTGALVVVDQLIKLVVTTQLQPIGSVSVIPGLLNLTYTQNFGAAFSMLSGKTWFFIIATAVVSAALILGLFLYKKHNWLSYTACTMIVAGGVGNLIDRIFNPGHFVTDYIQISFFPAIFNFADILVVVGTILLILFVLFYMGRDKEKSEKHRHGA
ncbi:MAG: signal peptidase II [Oscillospiraceae bacterium]|nr:signal peptidase II [Oscillospiraceae bacterium]